MSKDLRPRQSDPPPAICSERVLYYARLDESIEYRAGHVLMFIGGREVEKVPCLAICQLTQNTNTESVLLCYCDSDWSPIGVGGHESVAAAQRRAERIYPGVSSCWIEAQVTVEEVERYLDEQWGDERCHVCNKRGDKVDALIEQSVGWICDRCFAERKDTCRQDE